MQREIQPDMSTKKQKMPSHQERIEMAQNFMETMIPIVALSSGYIDIETTQFISGYTREGAKRALVRLARQGFMNEHKVPNMTGQKINIYGLTREGWDYAEIDRPNWTKQRYRANTRNHEMIILKIAHHIGVKKFSRAENIGGKLLKSGGYSGGRYPDLMDSKGRAVEIELTIKSSKRYTGILHNFHRTKTASIWFVPEKIAHRLAKIFGEVCEAKKYLKPEIFSLDDNLNLDEVVYSSAKERIKNYTAIEQIKTIEELSALLELHGNENSLVGYRYKPDIETTSQKGLIFDLNNGFHLVAKLLDAEAKVITDLYWKGESPQKLYTN